jgi:hypothetical protein
LILQPFSGRELSGHIFSLRHTAANKIIFSGQIKARSKDPVITGYAQFFPAELFFPPEFIPGSAVFRKKQFFILQQ